VAIGKSGADVCSAEKLTSMRRPRPDVAFRRPSFRFLETENRLVTKRTLFSLQRFSGGERRRVIQMVVWTRSVRGGRWEVGAVFREHPTPGFCRLYPRWWKTPANALKKSESYTNRIMDTKGGAQKLGDCPPTGGGRGKEPRMLRFLAREKRGKKCGSNSMVSFADLPGVFRGWVNGRARHEGC